MAVRPNIDEIERYLTNPDILYDRAHASGLILDLIRYVWYLEGLTQDIEPIRLDPHRARPKS